MHKKRWFLVISGALLLGALLVFMLVQTPPREGGRFHGTGSAQTPLFTVRDHWRLTLSCPLYHPRDPGYTVVLILLSQDGTPTGDGFSLHCTPEQVPVTWTVQAGGERSIHVMTSGDWTLLVENSPGSQGKFRQPFERAYVLML